MIVSVVDVATNRFFLGFFVCVCLSFVLHTALVMPHTYHIHCIMLLHGNDTLYCVNLNESTIEYVHDLNPIKARHSVWVEFGVRDSLSSSFKLPTQHTFSAGDAKSDSPDILCFFFNDDSFLSAWKNSFHSYSRAESIEVGKLNKGKNFDSLPFDTDYKQSNVVSLRFVAHNACIESAVFPWARNSGCHPLSRIVLVNSEMFRFFAENDEKSFRKKNLRALKRLQQADFRGTFIPPVHFVLADFARILFILVHNVNLSASILLLCKYVVALFRAPHFLLVTIRN